MNTVPREWRMRSDIPDLLRRWQARNHDLCDAVHTSHSLICTRMKGHTGRHAAAGVSTILAVWGDES